ncbi:MAG: tetratricopeptide repeat protein [Gemmatimonadetes bacterium]|nr:tetratricopeptide repeat protein [Gemmatimonadota bacterium]
MIQISLHSVLIVGIGLLYCGDPTAKENSTEAETRVAKLHQTGLEMLEQGRLEEAAKQLRSATEINHKHAPSYVGLGQVYLEQDSLKAAEQAFLKARHANEGYAPAYNGLGLVYWKKKTGRLWAIQYFRTAYQLDRRYSEAYYNAAEVYRELGDTKELDTYERLVEAFPEHRDAWFRIGEIHRTGGAGRYPNLTEAEAAYRQQLAVDVNHLAARSRLADVLAVRGNIDEALDLLEGFEDTSGVHSREVLLQQARIHQIRRDADRAEALYEEYIESLDWEEQLCFFDLSLVLDGAELDGFRVAPKSQWKELSNAFWAGKDPAPVTAANERRSEHYRRVAFSRELYGEHSYPWDVRGEVYVRYGEPDHVSKSDDIQFETAPRVVAVKERLINQAGDAIFALTRSRNDQMLEYVVTEAFNYNDPNREIQIGPMSSRQREIAETGNSRTYTAKEEDPMSEMRKSGSKRDKFGALQVPSASVLGWPVYPVPGKVWEYWIYTKVGPGIEITFVQPYHPGPYTYADMPHGIGEGGGSVSRSWREMNPAVVVERAVARSPEVYRQDFATAPLHFFYDTARFKKNNRSVNLEVYYGVPTRDITYVTGKDGQHVAHLTRGVALFNADDQRIYRSAEEMELYASGSPDTSRNAFLPFMDRISATPGNYRMAIQILDTSSGKSQVYNQRVRLTAFGGAYLRLSDIQLSAFIRSASDGRFVKGDIDVTPNPSQSYLAAQPVYIYYEIYNLKKDDFGVVRYRVTYQVESIDRQPIAVRILGGLGKLLGGREERESITVNYEHVGHRSDDQGYLELDMANSEQGSYMLRVKVTDIKSGESTVASKVFTIK